MRMRLKYILGALLILSVLFVCLTTLFMKTLDQTNGLTPSKSEEISYSISRSAEDEYKAEIEDLRQEVQILSQTISDFKLNNTKLPPVLLESEKLYADVMLHTEVFKGASYNNENAVEPFTHFNLWYIYPPYCSGSSGSTAVEKVHGLKRVSLLRHIFSPFPNFLHFLVLFCSK